MLLLLFLFNLNLFSSYIPSPGPFNLVLYCFSSAKEFPLLSCCFPVLLLKSALHHATPPPFLDSLPSLTSYKATKSIHPLQEWRSICFDSKSLGLILRSSTYLGRVTLGKPLAVSEDQFSHQNIGDNSTGSTNLSWWLNVLARLNSQQCARHALVVG